MEKFKIYIEKNKLYKNINIFAEKGQTGQTIIEIAYLKKQNK